MVPLKACWLNRTEMSCYFSHLSAVTDRGEFDESLIPGFPPLPGVGTVDIYETLIPGFPPLLGVGTVDIYETLIPGSHHYLVWGQWIFAVSSLPERAEMSRDCLFPDSIPNRDVKHRLLIKLTREGSYKLGGFHCLLPKDRITWDNQYIVHIYYIHIRTVVKEVNKGIRCANL